MDGPGKQTLSLTRRSVLAAGAAAFAGLVVGFRLPLGGRFEAAAADETWAPNAFVRIAPDSTVTVLIKHLDKGQGIATGLTTVIAEELDADWSQMRSEFAPANAQLYGNALIGGLQVTGGSTSMANSWDQLRAAGALARAQLLAAAAKTWGVPPAEITIDKGTVSHSSGKSASFGELVATAATLPPATDAKPKLAKEYKLVGLDKPGMRLDRVEKTTGKANFTIDVQNDGMKTAMVVHPPQFGGVATAINADEVKAIPGVLDCLIVPTGVVVIAEDTWSALKGKRAVKATWDSAKAETRGSKDLLAAFKQAAESDGDVAATRGDAKAALGSGSVIEATFEFPYLAHAPLEPVNVTLAWTPGGKAEMWYGCQGQTPDQYTVSSILGIKPEDVVIHTRWAGGSFGRRTTPMSDFAAEIALIAKTINGKWPLKLQYTREDDMQAGWYRPVAYHRLRAVLGADGKPIALHDRIVAQSFAKGTPLESAIVKNNIDYTSVEGAADQPYDIPNLLVDVTNPKIGVPTCWWRSVGHTHNAYAIETFIDELAWAAKQDPVAYRLALLGNSPRHVGVLKLAAEKAGWGAKLDKGKGRGVAVHESFNSYVANVIDVTVSPEGELKVDRVVCAVDCGVAVNPDIIRAQMEGGIGFALGAALRGEITLKDGVVEQTNFDTYQPLRLSEMPTVDVHIVPSSEPPTGVGEPGVPCVAPAVCNAVFAATGVRARNLPLSGVSLKWS